VTTLHGISPVLLRTREPGRWLWSALVDEGGILAPVIFFTMAWIVGGFWADFLPIAGLFALICGPSWLTLRYRAREVEITAETICWTPWLGRSRTLPMTAIRSYVGVENLHQVLLRTDAGHRNLVLAKELPEFNRALALILTHAEHAVLEPGVGIGRLRFFWFGRARGMRSITSRDALWWNGGVLATWGRPDAW
jgi:hypothetical protein